MHVDLKECTFCALGSYEWAVFYVWFYNSMAAFVWLTCTHLQLHASAITCTWARFLQHMLLSGRECFMEYIWNNFRKIAKVAAIWYLWESRKEMSPHSLLSNFTLDQPHTNDIYGSSSTKWFGISESGNKFWFWLVAPNAELRGDLINSLPPLTSGQSWCSTCWLHFCCHSLQLLSKNHPVTDKVHLPQVLWTFP